VASVRVFAARMAAAKPQGWVYASQEDAAARRTTGIQTTKKTGAIYLYKDDPGMTHLSRIFQVQKLSEWYPPGRH